MCVCIVLCLHWNDLLKTALCSYVFWSLLRVPIYLSSPRVKFMFIVVAVKSVASTSHIPFSIPVFVPLRSPTLWCMTLRNLPYDDNKMDKNMFSKPMSFAHLSQKIPSFNNLHFSGTTKFKFPITVANNPRLYCVMHDSFRIWCYNGNQMV